jgi:hypothetical protein
LPRLYFTTRWHPASEKDSGQNWPLKAAGFELLNINPAAFAAVVHDRKVIFAILCLIIKIEWMFLNAQKYL